MASRLWSELAEHAHTVKDLLYLHSGVQANTSFAKIDQKIQGAKGDASLLELMVSESQEHIAELHDLLAGRVSADKPGCRSNREDGSCDTDADCDGTEEVETIKIHSSSANKLVELPGQPQSCEASYPKIGNKKGERNSTTQRGFILARWILPSDYSDSPQEKTYFMSTCRCKPRFVQLRTDYYQLAGKTCGCAKTDKECVKGYKDKGSKVRCDGSPILGAYLASLGIKGDVLP